MLDRTNSNFANDAAMDFADELIRGIVSRIEGAFADRGRLEPDEYYGSALPGIIEVLAGLAKITCSSTIPRPEIVANWKANFLAVWDQSASNVAADPARRKVIMSAFDALLRQSRRLHLD